MRSFVVKMELTLWTMPSSSFAFSSSSMPLSRLSAALSTTRPKPAEAFAESTTRHTQPGCSSMSASAAMRALLQEPEMAAASEMCSTGLPSSARGRQNSVNSSGFIWLVLAMPPARMRS